MSLKKKKKKHYLFLNNLQLLIILECKYKFIFLPHILKLFK